MAEELHRTHSWEDLLGTLRAAEQYHEIESLTEVVEAIVDDGFDEYVFRDLIEPRMPKFLYFDEYYMMRGSENLNALLDRERSGDLRDSDRPLVGLINLARLDMEHLLAIDNTDRLKNMLDATVNRLTRQIRRHWSQNRHLSMQFDVREAKPGDPEGMNMRGSTNIWGEVYDTVREARTSLDSRSRGFLWFFSFLAWYQNVKGENIVLLLDEPGTSLHGLAKRDLLKYFETELTSHQLLYTTHSPFMIEPEKIERVRIVQDLGIDASEELPRCEDGTKVVPNILEANKDSLFPLLRELGYGITQTLLVGTNVLIVEGQSDVKYVDAMSGVLEAEEREGLSPKWTKLAADGIDRVPLFVSFLAAQEDLNVAALVDYQKRHQQLIESLYKNKHLKKKNVLTFAQFTTKREADVEDLFEREFFIGLLHSEFGDEIEGLSAGDLAASPRVVKDVEERLGREFNHYRPARYLCENVETLRGQLSDETKDRFEKLFKKLNALVD